MGAGRGRKEVRKRVKEEGEEGRRPAGRKKRKEGGMKKQRLGGKASMLILLPWLCLIFKRAIWQIKAYTGG